MKRYSAYFEYLLPLTPQSKKDFEWWENIIPLFLERSDSFQLDCKKSDEEGLRSCARMGVENRASLNIDGKTEIWCGNVDEKFGKELLTKAFDAQGKVKWSSILLRLDGKITTAITRNGKEVGVHGLLEEELEFLASEFHGHNFSFYFWEDSGNGNLTHFKPIYGGESEISVLFEAYHKGNKNKFK